MKKLSLAHLPTKLHALPRLSQCLGGPDIWIKRDDNTGLGLGGNKARKLEYLLADAVSQDCNVVITAGGVQSNHARMTAAATASLGLECHLVLRGEQRAQQGNLLLDSMFGAHVHLLNPDEDREEKMEAIANRNRQDGKKPYVICIGGSNSLGSLGYVDAAEELLTQVPNPDYFHEILLAVGSGGTYAGLLSGIMKHGLQTTLRGISVDDQDFTPIIFDICNASHHNYNFPAVKRTDITLETGYLGAGYAKPSSAGDEAIKLLAQLEGILLDPVYTGKAMAGLIDGIRSKKYDQTKPILFWHTGGAPALFAAE